MPPRLRNIKAALREYDIEVVTGTKHYQARRGVDVYPIPAHNGEKSEVPDVYIRGLCRRFNIDEAEFRNKI